MKENFAIKILFHVQFIAGIVLHKRDINGRSSRIGSPCNDSSPPPPRHPLSISFFPGVSYASLVKVASYLSLPRFILDFRPGHTRGRKPLIYALSDPIDRFEFDQSFELARQTCDQFILPVATSRNTRGLFSYRNWK